MATFNFEAALKDGVPIEMINREAAKRIGFKYDLAKQDGVPEEEILAELQRRYGRKTTLGEDIQGAFAKTMGTLAQGVGMGAEVLARPFGEQDKAIADTEAMVDYWKSQDPTLGKEQGAGKLVNAAVALPMYMSPPGLATMMAGSARQTGTDIIKEGGDVPTATTAALADVAMQGAGAALPVGMVAGKAKNALAGAGSNIAQEIANRQIQNTIREDANLQQLPGMDAWDVAAAGIPGAGMGFAFARSKGTTGDKALDIYAKLKEQATTQKPVEPPNPHANFDLEGALTQPKLGKKVVAPQYDLIRQGVHDEAGNYIHPELTDKVKADIDASPVIRTIEENLKAKGVKTEPLSLEERLRTNLELVPKEPDIPVVGKEITRSPEIDELYFRLEKTKQDEIELAYKQKALEDERPVLSKEEAFARQEELTKDRENIDKERAKLLDESDKFEPSQSSKQIEKITAPIGNRAFGKKQRGGFTPFDSTPTYDKFVQQYKNKIEPDYLPKVYKELTGKEPTTQEMVKANPVLEKQAEQAKKSKFIASKYTGDIIPNEEFIPAVKDIPDINPGIYKRFFASSGRLQAELFDHPVTTQIYNIALKAKESAELATRKLLDDPVTGVIPFFTKNARLGNVKENLAYFKWRHENQNATELPMQFSDTIRKAHEREVAASSELYRAMQEVAPDRFGEGAKELANHLVHLWNGPYRFYVKATDSKGVSRIVTYVAEKNKGDAQKAVEYYKANHPEFELTPISFVPQSARMKSSMFDHLLDIAKESDPVVTEALNSMISGRSRSIEEFKGVQNRFKARAGKEGFLGAKPWLSEMQNYRDTLEAMKMKYDAGYHWIELQKAKEQIKPLQEAAARGELKAGTAVQLGTQYLNYAFGRTNEASSVTKALDTLESIAAPFGSVRRGTDVANTALNKITIPWLLALKSSTFIQGVAQPIVTIPRMVKLTNELGGNYSTIPVAFGKGLFDGLISFGDSLTFNATSKLADKLLSPTAKAIREEIRNKDISRVSMLEQSPFFGHGGQAKEIGNIIAEIPNATLSMIEGPTRAWAYSAYVHKFVADGVPLKDALNMAHNQMDTMTNYNAEASPMIFGEMGAIGSDARGLHTFMSNYYTQIALAVQDAVKGASKLSAKESVPLALHLGNTLAFAGAVGFIGVDLAEWLLKKYQTAVQEYIPSLDSKELQEFSMKKWMLENMPDSLSVGPIASATGLNTYGSFSSKIIDPDRGFLDSVFPKTLAKANILEGVVSLPKLLDSKASDIEKGNVLEKVAPKFLTNKIRKHYSEKIVETPEGTQSIVLNRGSKNEGEPLYVRSPLETKVAHKGFGLKSLSEALSTQQSIEDIAIEKRRTDSQNKQLEKLDADIRKEVVFGTPSPRLRSTINNLITSWGVDPDAINARIQHVAEKTGIPDANTRTLIAYTKNIKSQAQVEKANRAIKSFNKTKEWKERYGVVK